MRIRIGSMRLKILAEAKRNIKRTQDWDLKTRSMIHSVALLLYPCHFFYFFANGFESSDDNLSVSNEEKY